MRLLTSVPSCEVAEAGLKAIIGPPLRLFGLWGRVAGAIQPVLEKLPATIYGSGARRLAPGGAVNLPKAQALMCPPVTEGVATPVTSQRDPATGSGVSVAPALAGRDLIKDHFCRHFAASHLHR